ncbi:MAG: hypothetical protein BRC55_00330 [Cyanobacteria bacterium SW_8_48_13]|nr:MAG: hypothetical protein BRC55_00330 [Cyanobacteria bacterium SW_8_48_13]
MRTPICSFLSRNSCLQSTTFLSRTKHHFNWGNNPPNFLGGITFDGGTNGIAFRVLIEKLFVPQLWSGACVVMDNLPAHQVKGVKEMIESAGASLIYLSPYSPDFNPIKHYWSKLKQYLRSVAARSRKALEKTISLGLDLITENDIRNWFAHCCYCTS